MPLEYAIRAIKQSAPDEYERLKSIDTRIQEVWRQFNYTDEQIKGLQLKDFAWDELQLQRQYTRLFGKVFAPRVHHDCSIGLASIYDFAKEVSELNLPFAAKNFRYCDLLNGNDIPRLLAKILDVKKKFGNYNEVSSIPFADFAFFIRTPIQVYDEFFFVDGKTIKFSDGKPLDNANNVTAFVVRIDKPIPDFQAMLNELTLEYAKNRMCYLNEHPEETDESLNSLVKDTLHNEMYNIPNIVIKGHNGLTPPLIGLYCWDLIQDYSWEYIFDKLKGEFNISLATDTIKKYYRHTKKEIDSLVTASVTR